MKMNTKKTSSGPAKKEVKKEGKKGPTEVMENSKQPLSQKDPHPALEKRAQGIDEAGVVAPERPDIAVSKEVMTRARLTESMVKERRERIAVLKEEVLQLMMAHREELSVEFDVNKNGKHKLGEFWVMFIVGD